MNRKKAILGAFAALLIGSASAGEYYSKQPVGKQPYQSRGVVGEIGLGLGWNWLNDDDDDSASVYFATINGSIAYPVGDLYTFAFDAYARYDDLSSDSDYDDSEDPEFEYSVGAHFLRDVGYDSRLGLFVAYGDTRPQDWDRSDSYDVLMGGIEYQHFLTENVLVFAQLGYGDKVRNGQDSEEGFNGGFISRAGATYFMNERTAITLDFEASFANPYIDGDDPGHFYGVTLGGETRLSDHSPFYLTYFARYDFIDSTSENDWVEEAQVGVGIKYLFGAGSSKEAARAGKSIGTPRLPVRGSAWTEYLD